MFQFIFENYEFTNFNFYTVILAYFIIMSVEMIDLPNMHETFFITKKIFVI